MLVWGIVYPHCKLLKVRWIVPLLFQALDLHTNLRTRATNPKIPPECAERICMHNVCVGWGGVGGMCVCVFTYMLVRYKSVLQIMVRARNKRAVVAAMFRSLRSSTAPISAYIQEIGGASFR